MLLKSFSDIKIEVRNGTAIVNKMAEALEELLLRRTHAAEEIMRRAEELATGAQEPDDSYTFDYSVVSILYFKYVAKKSIWSLLVVYISHFEISYSLCINRIELLNNNY